MEVLTDRPADCRSSRSPLTPPRFPPTESQDSGYLYFCFRWLLIRFKRELSFMDVLRLWEVSSPAAPRSGGGGVSFSASPSPPPPPHPHSSHPQVMWTDLPCQNFHLLVCCAILDSEKQKIMEENYGFNEILKVRLRCRRRPRPSPRQYPGLTNKARNVDAAPWWPWSLVW